MFDSINIQVIVTGVVGLITTITSSWFSWFLAKKKYNTEVDSVIISNMQESLEFYKKLSDDNKLRLDEVLKKNVQLEKSNDQLRDELLQIRTQVFDLMKNICYSYECTSRKLIQEIKKTRKANKDGAPS